MLQARYIAFAITVVACGTYVCAAAAQGETAFALPLGAYDGQGRFIRDIGPANLSVRGLQGSVRDVRLDTGPRKIALMIDTGGGIGDENHPVWRQTLEAARAFIEAAREEDKLALYRFPIARAAPSQGFAALALAQPMTADHRSVEAALHGLKPMANGIHEVIFENYLDAVLKEPLVWGDAIVVISDGYYVRIRDKRLDPKLMQKVISKAIGMGVRIFLLRIDTALPRNYQQHFARNLAEVVVQTGGLEINATAAFEFFSLDGRYQSSRPTEDSPVAQAARLTHLLVALCYRVDLATIQPLTKQVKYRLQLRQSAEKWKGAKLFYPHFLAPGS